MNKAELIDAVAAAADLSKSDAGKAVEAVTSTVAKTLGSGGQVAIVGFGTFSVKHRAAREGRNPKTGEAVALPGKHVPHFKPGKELRERVDNNR